MKKIIKRTGDSLTIEEARSLSRRAKDVFTFVHVSEYRSVYPYSTEELAKNANLQNALDAHKGYTFLFIGTEYVSSSVDKNNGYKVVVIGLKDLPPNFEEKFPDYVIMG